MSGLVNFAHRQELTPYTFARLRVEEGNLDAALVLAVVDLRFALGDRETWRTLQEETPR